MDVEPSSTLQAQPLGSAQPAMASPVPVSVLQAQSPVVANAVPAVPLQAFAPTVLNQKPPQAPVASKPLESSDVQRYLDENQALLAAIVENINKGRAEEASTLQLRLQRNLLYLASLAEAHGALS